MSKLKSHGWRLNFLYFLIRKVAKVPEGQIVPKWILVIRYIFFPFEWVVHFRKDTHIHYDPITDIFTIYGKKYSGAFFTMPFKHGQTFKIINDPAEREYMTMEQVSVPPSDFKDGRYIGDSPIFLNEKRPSATGSEYKDVCCICKLENGNITKKGEWVYPLSRWGHWGRFCKKHSIMLGYDGIIQARKWAKAYNLKFKDPFEKQKIKQ